MAISTAAASQQVPTTEYARLEERIIERDRVGGSQVLCGHTQAAGRDRLLLASAKHTAGHKKYGDPLESYRRFAEALDLAGC